MEQLSFITSPLLTWLFESTIYISILICLIFIIKALTKRRLPAWWSYCLWLLLLFRMLIPFGVETPVSVYNYVPAPPENDLYMSYLEEHRLYMPFMQPPPYTSPAVIPTDKGISDRAITNKQDNNVVPVTGIADFNLSFAEVLLIIWFIGVMAFGIVTIYKNLKFWKTIKHEKPLNDIAVLELFDECKSTLGIQKKVEIIVTDSVKSPAIFGYIKPQLLLPQHFLDTLNIDELKCVFLHELGHMKRHDIGVSWLVTVFQITYWFNPLVWHAFHHLRADQEAACDAYVLSRLKQVRPTDYAQTIVNLLERFVQNRQLPSLAGIIENRSQIDRRISMILDYKRITLKKTLVSVLMLFILICAFIACSTGRLTKGESSGSNITQPENSDMKNYKNDDWYFSLDIPSHWITSLPLPEYLANKGEVISFGSNDNGLEALRIFIIPLSLNEVLDRIKKQLTDEGYGNLITTEAKIGSGKALILDYDKQVKDGSLRTHSYLVPYQSIIYLLNFATTRPDPTFELYDRIAKTFEHYETSVAQGVKKYVSPDGNISMEIPANWKTLPLVNKSIELIRFGTPENGPIAVIYTPEYSPWKSLEVFRTWVQEISTKEGSKDFINSVTVINGRRTLILESNDGSLSFRDYFFEDEGYKYMVAFSANTKNGIPADKLVEYDHVMGSYSYSKKPKTIADGMKEYTGPDNKKPLASGMKRYLSPGGDYTVDVPGNWRPYVQENEYGKTCLFGTPENGLVAVFYPRWYSLGHTIEGIRDNQIKANTDSGWSILSKSQTVINGRNTLILDAKTVFSTNARNYFFKEGDYIYSVLFYAFNTEGIPADRVEGYEQVMKSINIINKGSNLEKTLSPGIARAGTLPIQFRFGENEPGKALKEMTVSGSDRKVYLHMESVLSNADIQGASVQKTKDGFGISLTFTEVGGKKFEEITRDNIGKILAIVVDGKLITVPVIRESITGGQAFIHGKFTQEEAIRIARGIVGGK